MTADKWRVDDHVQDGLSRLLSQYRDKPVLRALLTSYLEEIQELSDQIWQTILMRMVDHAVGAHLDAIGRIVMQPRNGRADSAYRGLVRAKIAANFSSGLVDHLLRVSWLLTGSRARLDELYPDSVSIDIGELEAHLEAAEMLNLARGAGFGLSVVFHDGHDASQVFTFADGDGFDEVDAARGFGGDDPTTGPGGFWAGVY